jgi:hypothetical protein
VAALCLLQVVIVLLWAPGAPWASVVLGTLLLLGLVVLGPQAAAAARLSARGDR